jgi:hypothetical protein
MIIRNQRVDESQHPGEEAARALLVVEGSRAHVFLPRLAHNAFDAASIERLPATPRAKD